MKFIQILYSTPMVQAVIEDRKTQTRRLKGLEKINENPDHWEFLFFAYTDTVFVFQNKKTKEKVCIKCQYGTHDDVLWVRETYCGIIQSDETVKYHYKADANWALDSALKIFWKPSIHMPKEAARFFLQIKNIRVERLIDISESDAIAEGIEPGKRVGFWKDYFYSKLNEDCILPTTSFFTLWQSINGEVSLELNPWVWVIEFEKIEKPENFI